MEGRGVMGGKPLSTQGLKVLGKWDNSDHFLLVHLRPSFWSYDDLSIENLGHGLVLRSLSSKHLAWNSGPL